jgi:hypothetical protein
VFIYLRRFRRLVIEEIIDEQLRDHLRGWIDVERRDQRRNVNQERVNGVQENEVLIASLETSDHLFYEVFQIPFAENLHAFGETISGLITDGIET